jgi:hypothetical protein
MGGSRKTESRAGSPPAPLPTKDISLIITYAISLTLVIVGSFAGITRSNIDFKMALNAT